MSSIILQYLENCEILLLLIFCRIFCITLQCIVKDILLLRYLDVLICANQIVCLSAICFSFVVSPVKNPEKND